MLNEQSAIHKLIQEWNKEFTEAQAKQQRLFAELMSLVSPSMETASKKAPIAKWEDAKKTDLAEEGATRQEKSAERTKELDERLQRGSVNLDNFVAERAQKRDKILLDSVKKGLKRKYKSQIEFTNNSNGWVAKLRSAQPPGT